MKSKHLLTTMLVIGLNVAGLITYGQMSKVPEPMVCSFNCSNSYTDLQARCGTGLITAKPLPPTAVNPFVEFDDIVSKLHKDNANPFPLIYTFLPCEATCNAASTRDASSREIIYYNQDFINKIKGTNEKIRWAIRCIIAHEIGHHFMGHTVNDSDDLDIHERRRREKRADFFTGFVISQYEGATVNSAMEGILTLDRTTYTPVMMQRKITVFTLPLHTG